MIVDSASGQSNIGKSGLVAALSVLILTLICSIASAGTRVLVRFDETGHYVHRVHRSASLDTPAVDTLRATELLVTNSEVSLRWRDSDGKLVAATRLIDPRVTHAPLELGSSELAWTVLREGAYMASGPDSAVQLEIILPARSTPSVPAETWVLDLKVGP